MSRSINNFRGTGVAMVTPFKNNGAIDFPALGKLTDSLIKNKCDYLVPLGTTGESVTMSFDEKQSVLEFIKERNNGRLPIVLGLGGNNTQEVINDFRKYDFKGVDAILSVSPAYNKPTQQGIYEHYKAIVNETALPVIIYNVPGRTSSNITSDTTLKLANDFKNIIGTKEASGNFEQCMFIIRNRPQNFLVISGDDAITLPLIGAGADGVISVIANAYPKSFSEMVRQALKNNFVNSRKLHYKLLPLIPLLFSEGSPAGIKTALAAKNVCGEKVRLPLVGVSKKLKNDITSFVKKVPDSL